MTIGDALTRRRLLALLIGLATLSVTPAFAKDGDSSGDSGSDSDGDDGDSDDADSNDNDDNDDDSDDSDDSSGKGNGRLDSDKIRDAVKSGEALSLSKAMGLLDQESVGRVIDVSLVAKGNVLKYRFKVVTPSGKIKNISMDAKTGRIRNFLGF
jgi:uncharacterized membrane protein YkoI